MGLYDINLKRTGLGYQFDRNVYIGLQTNDNRVVTFKDLSDTISSSVVGGGGGGSGEDIQLTVDSITGNPTNPADHISFRRDGEDVAFDILPQFVRAADADELTDEELANAKACLLLPVTDENDNIIGYKVYYAGTTDLPVLEMIVHGESYTYDGTTAMTVDFSSQTLTIAAGGQTYSYDGTTAVSITFSALPTIAASAVEIATSIGSSSETAASSRIPTEGAVYEFAAAAGSVKATKASAGYLAGTEGPVTATDSASAQALHPVGTDTLKWDSDNTALPAASYWINANITGQLNHTLTVAAGGTNYAFDGHEDKSIIFNTLPTIAASAVEIATSIGSSSETAASSRIPTEGAVYEFAAAAGSVKATASTSGFIVGTPSQVTATSVASASPLAPIGTDLKWGESAAVVGSPGKWINANITGQLNHTLTIAAGGNNYAFDGHEDKSIAFNALPTIAASAVTIATEVASSTSPNIPTEGAVYNAIQELSPGIGGISVSTTGNAITTLTYSATDKILVASRDTFLTTVLSGTAINVTGSGDSRTINLHATFSNPALAWGSAVTYAEVGGTTYSISLPTVNVLPTIAASAVAITTSVSSSASSDIPTEGAVYEAIQQLSPGIGSIVTDGNGNAITSLTYSSASKTLTATKSTTFVTNVTHDTGITVTSSDNGAVRTVKFDGSFVNAAPAFGGSAKFATLAGTNYSVSIPALPAYTVFGQTITAGATQAVEAGTGLSVVTNGTTSTVSLNASFQNPALAWGTATKYVSVAGTDYSISLPTVDVLPTIAASAIAITGTVSSDSTANEIPTALAVWSVANAAGKVKEIRIGGATQTITAGVVDLPAYPTTLPASDVYSWAKAANKPSYGWSEIDNKPALSITGTASTGTITIGSNTAVFSYDSTSGILTIDFN